MMLLGLRDWAPALTPRLERPTEALSSRSAKRRQVVENFTTAVAEGVS
jgi:hypothetical protein